MDEAFITLYQTPTHRIFLKGTIKERVEGPQAAKFIELSSLHLPDGESFAFAEPVEFSRVDLLEPALAAGVSDYRFKADVANGVTITAGFDFDGETFFGQSFDTTADVSAFLTVRIPSAESDLPRQPFVVIRVCGRLEISAPPVTFQTDVLCFEVTINNLPESLPSIELPAFHVALPDFGFDFPHLPINWDFPRFPPAPFRLPSFSSTAESPLKLSWKSAQVQADESGLTIDIAQLRVEGKIGAIEGDLHLVLVGGRVKTSESFFHLYRPDFANRFKIEVDQWYFDEQCLGIKWKEPQLNAWLRLLAPELANTQEANATSVTLRIMRRGSGLDEIRLDWESAGSPTVFNLPGFKITIPPILMYSLILRTSQTGDQSLAFLTTLAAETEDEGEGDIPEQADEEDDAGGAPATPDPAEGEAVSPPGPPLTQFQFKAESNFLLFHNDQRELHQDEQRVPDPLIQLTATPGRVLSLILVDIPLSGPNKISFFKQLDHALHPLVFDDGAEEANRPSECVPIRLRKADWSVALKFNVDEAKHFFLPFLKKGNEGGGLLNELSQSISITAGETKVVFEDEQHPEIHPHILCKLDVTVSLGSLQIGTNVELKFDWESFAFNIDDSEGITFSLKEYRPQEFLGVTWQFKANSAKELFTLVTKDANYQLKQADGSAIDVDFTRATSRDQPIRFTMTDFVLGPAGVSVNGRVTDSPARLNGIGEKFRFTQGSFQIRDNHLTDFSIAGSGPLPPALVGNATADISLQFGQRNGALQLIAGAAQLRGTKLLKCSGTRFQFSVDGIGLKFVNDGSYHLYFTLTGMARFVPFASDDASGPLSWLPAIEMQLLDCPLTGDARTISKHVKFLVELPKKKTFDFLGCFKMELRGIGFVPQAEMFDNEASAMELSGQIKFAEGDGDVLDVRIDFHSLFIGLPAPGEIVPRIHFKNLGVKIRKGDVFELEGSIDYIADEIEPGLQAKGFAGQGTLSIQGLPTIAATFTFIRVSRDGGATWVKAWFVYLEARKLSLMIPIIKVYIREIGLGFGYRYTLASIKAADEIDDPRELLRVLTKLSRTQGQLSRRDQWRVDLEDPGEDARWTVALRAMISQTTAANGVTDWHELAEKTLSSLFVMDVVIALRSDLTFLMTGRAWLMTNYNDYLTDVNGLQSKPLLSGFLLLSPRKKRLLAHLASNPGAEFGDHPPLPGFLKSALAQSQFSATLLIEPGLLHYELGWPNMLRWRAKLGPLDAEFRGGAIFRISRRELVIGNSFMARGSLELSAEINLGFVGARLSATANVAYGARYIGVIAFDEPAARSALYGAVGIEIHVEVQIDFWLEIDLWLATIRLDFHFSFGINFTAFLEVGLTAGDLIGARGTATVSLNILGHGLCFGIHVGINESAVDAARRITEPYLHIGLEASEVESIPGVDSGKGLSAPANNGPSVLQPPANAAPAAPVAAAAMAAAPPAALAIEPPNPDAALAVEGVPPAVEPEHEFKVPGYTLFSIPYTDETGETSRYFALVPRAEELEGEPERGFLPVPPREGTIVANDFHLKGLPALPENVTLKRFNPIASTWDLPDTSGEFEWGINWDNKIGDYDLVNPQTKQNKDATKRITLKNLVRHAFLTRQVPTVSTGNEAQDDNLEIYEPINDPTPPPTPQGRFDDERVHHPSDDAFEAAVRGAFEQFEGSPYFKHDSTSEYETKLRDAFKPDTSIYSNDGGNVSPENLKDIKRTQQAVEMRSLIIKQMIDGLQSYLKRIKSGNEAEPDVADNLVFQFGLVFRTQGGTPDWLSQPLTPSGIEITQRRTVVATEPDGREPKPVEAFNSEATSFEKNPPQFQKVKHYTDANTIAITWDLVWPSVNDAPSRISKDEPEHHLLNYLVRRRPLGGERVVEYTIKPVDILNRNGGTIERLKPRFQIVDHFNEETAADQAALPPQGKSYVYTIIPIDVAGTPSRRPLTIIATRRANLPPPVPADGEMIVKYQLKPEYFQDPAPRPEIFTPEKVVVKSSAQSIETGLPVIAVAETRLIFRKETVLPTGSYGLDSESHGSRTSGLPTSNARVLRTDIVVSLGSQNGNEREVSIEELKAKGVFPENDWRPESWQVFLQTRSDQGVFSALTPVAIVLQFRAEEDDESRRVERRPGRLEWLTKAMRFDALPPEDEKADDGFALVPMPLVENPATEIGVLKTIRDFTSKIKYTQHPFDLRCLRFQWNQAPSRRDAYPVQLHAGYRLYEFDLDEHTAQILDHPPDDFWLRLRAVQAMEILSGDGQLLTPGDTLTANKWEAWYPSSLRRQFIRANAKENVPPKQSEAKMSPWYSWRDSYLEWPADESLRNPESDAAATTPITGFMQIVASENKIIATRDSIGAFKKEDHELDDQLMIRLKKLFEHRFVRIFGAKNDRNNGCKRLVKFELAGTDSCAFIFEAGSFAVDEPLVTKEPAAADDRVVTGPMRIIDGAQKIECLSEKLNRFSPGQSVRISGATQNRNNGIKTIIQPTLGSNQAPGENELSFKPGSFTPEEDVHEIRIDAFNLTIDLRPFQALHPVLEKLIQDLGDAEVGPETAKQRITVDLCPPPATQARDLKTLLKATSPDSDPYGWNTLKRMGLAVTFCLRDSRTGELLDTALAQQAVQAALEAYIPKDGGTPETDFFKHLHIEYLFQPARSMRLKDEEPKPSEQDLLALIQVSLRPAPRQLYQYSRFDLSKGINTVVSGGMSISKNDSKISRVGGLDVFSIGQFVKVSGARNGANNGIKRIADVMNGVELTFEPRAFVEDEKTVVGSMTIMVASQTIQGPAINEEAGLKAGQFVEVSGAQVAGNNGLKKIVEADLTAGKLTFSAGSLVADQVNAELAIGSPRLRIETNTSEGDEAAGGDHIRLTISVPADEVHPENSAPSFTLIEQTGVIAEIPVERGGKFEKDFLVPAAGKVTLLLRSTKPETFKIQGDAKVESLFLNPTDWPVLLFTAPPNPWPRETPRADNPEKDAPLEDDPVRKEWDRFRRYLLRVNPANAASTTDPKIQFPADSDENGISELMSWLTRFFEECADILPKDDAASGVAGGPWLATAYPRSLSPIGVVPDAIGRLKFYQPVEDQWGHVYRYYILPQGRYYQLWEALAQSNFLYKEPQEREENLRGLRGTAPPTDGGIDIVLDRIKSVAAPLVLFSGRLDVKPGKAEVAPPGKTWEVIVAKHPEQWLIERNRTLVRHLAYRHIAHTLLRRFAYGADLQSLRDILHKQGDTLEILHVENAFPNEAFDAYSTPEQIDLQTAGPSDLRTLEIPERLGVFGKDALVLQWEALPYFYEHCLLLVAQTAARVSPVSDLLHKDFEYESPIPSAAAEGIELGAQRRALLLLIELKSYWDCLPKEAQERWPMERWRPDNAPAGSSGAGDEIQPRKLASLPDMGVVYQLVMRRDSGLIETLSEVFFDPQKAEQQNAEQQNAGAPEADPKNTSGYAVRSFNAQFTLQPKRLVAPRGSDSAQRPMHLQTIVSWETKIPLQRQPDFAFKGDFTPLHYYRALIDSVEEFEFLPDKPQADAKPEDLDRFLKRWYSVRAVSQLPVDELPPDLLDLIDFFPLDAPAVAWTGAPTPALLSSLDTWIAANPVEVADVLRSIKEALDAGKDPVIRQLLQEPISVPAALRDHVLIGRFLLRCRTHLDEQQRTTLRTLYPSAPDTSSLARLFADLDDRHTLDGVLAEWANEEAVSSRAAIRPVAQELEGRIRFPAPMSCRLALQGPLETSERRELEMLAATSDISFGMALRQLLIEADGDETVFAEAGVGLEQIKEIAESSQVVLPTPENRKLKWLGRMTQDQRETMARWSEVSSFATTFKALLDSSDACEIEFAFDPDPPHPGQGDLPPVLVRRLMIDASTLRWRGLLLSEDQEEALRKLERNAGTNASFTTSIQELLAALTQPGADLRAQVEIEVREKDWRPRPSPAQLSNGLREKLLIGGGLIRCYGWMTREEGLGLQAQLVPASLEPDRQAIARLFADSLRAGLGGGSLQVNARRGSAKAQSGDLASEL